MHTLPTSMIQVLTPFAPLFSERVFQHVQLLLVGAILAPGKRTVASALRAVSLEDERCFCRYHRVLNRAVSGRAGRQAASCWGCSWKPSRARRRTAGCGHRRDVGEAAREEDFCQRHLPRPGALKP